METTKDTFKFFVTNIIAEAEAMQFNIVLAPTWVNQRTNTKIRNPDKSIKMKILNEYHREQQLK